MFLGVEGGRRRRGAAGAAGSRPGRAPDLACFLPIDGDGSDGIGYDSRTMKQQPGPLVKVLALATSFALVAVYVTYRVANAKSERTAAPAPTAPAPPKDREPLALPWHPSLSDRARHGEAAPHRPRPR